MTERRQLTFALVREGSTDDGLVRLIREVIIASAGERINVVMGERRTYGGRPATQVARIMQEEGTSVDLLFIHHDSDDRDHTSMAQEIHDAARDFSSPDSVIPIVPVQETEAWLLADEELIQSVIGRRTGLLDRSGLGIPELNRIEDTASPKEILHEALVKATKDSRRARKRTRSRLSDLKASIMDFLDIDGPLSALPSWKRFREDTETAVERLLA